MANNTVTVSGMFGNGKTYFADSPVVIDIGWLEWPSASPFNIVRLEVIYSGNVVGEFCADTGGQSEISFDISSALRSIWTDYSFDSEVGEAIDALTANSAQFYERSMRQYSLRVYTEYLASDDGGVFTTTGYGPFTGGKCLLGGLTEWERSLISDKANADVSHLEHTGARNGDASTKPISSPERVGSNSITSWVDVQSECTKSIFYPTGVSQASDDPTAQNAWGGHAPIVLRDSIPYTDFLFVNRRGAVETCSAQMLEALDIDVAVEQYSRVERPAFKPSRSLMSIASGGRRSWPMSSGYQAREWAEWWTLEFLKAKRWWMRYKSTFVPVIVKPAKDSNRIYDRSKQEMPHVDFWVTLALEG